MLSAWPKQQLENRCITAVARFNARRSHERASVPTKSASIRLSSLHGHRAAPYPPPHNLPGCAPRRADRAHRRSQIDTEGKEAIDTFLVSYHGEPLDKNMSLLVTNALHYYLSLTELEKEESY